MPNLIRRIHDYYCVGVSFQCARRWIYDTLGEAFVPPLLLPNQWEWARQIATETEGNVGASENTGSDPVQKTTLNEANSDCMLD